MQRNFRLHIRTQANEYVTERAVHLADIELNNALMSQFVLRFETVQKKTMSEMSYSSAKRCI